VNTGRERVVTILLLVGLTATFTAAVSLPGRRAAAATKQEIAHAKAEIARGTEALGRYKAERLELEKRLRYLAESSDAVAPADPHELLGRISRFALGSGLTVKRLEPEPARPQASYDEHPFRLEFHGSLDALAGFLRALETGPRCFAVEDLTIRPPGEQADREVLEGSLRFSVFAERGDAGGFDEESGSAAAL
jgi:Tfp pilus assembly protein PilO